MKIKLGFILALFFLLTLAVAHAQGTADNTAGQNAADQLPQPATKDGPAQGDQVNSQSGKDANTADNPKIGQVASDDSRKAAEEANALKLKNLEEKVNQLKEKVFRSKARLMLLQETVLTGRIANAKVRIVHRNDLGFFFNLESVTYSLDGTPILSKIDKGGELKKEFDVLPVSNLVAGTHNLTATVIVKGSGHGFFSYMDGYKFKIRSSVIFATEEGKITTITINPYERGNLSTDFKERPALRFEVEMKPDIEAKQKLK